MLDPYTSRRPPTDSSAIYSHSRTRTTSSGTFPLPIQTQPQNPAHLQQPQQYQQTRRSPSVGTFSTTSSQPPPPAAYRTSPTSDIRRSTSSRSGGTSQQPSGYVALLRKQKATVWCDRSQWEDPRIAAAQRAAKMRAAMEVTGAGSRGTSSGGLAPPSSRTATGISATGKVAAKIRHHGKPGVVGYAPGGNLAGVGGVPMRLSATEVEAESSEDESAEFGGGGKGHHRRTGSSGRSSTASRRGLTYRTSGGGGSIGGGQRWSPGDTPERTSSILEEPREGAQFSVVNKDRESPLPDAASGRPGSTASGSSSAERADAVGELTAPGAPGAGGSAAARLASNSLMNATLTREKSVKNPEDLRRRGSVDERTTTLTSAGRLFIANPD